MQNTHPPPTVSLFLAWLAPRFPIRLMFRIDRARINAMDYSVHSLDIQEVNKQAATAPGYVVHRCWKGFVELAIPLRRHGVHAGTLFAGQWRTKGRRVSRLPDRRAMDDIARLGLTLFLFSFPPLLLNEKREDLLPLPSLWSLNPRLGSSLHPLAKRALLASRSRAPCLEPRGPAH
jgi:hypothetical protein